MIADVIYTISFFADKCIDQQKEITKQLPSYIDKHEEKTNNVIKCIECDTILSGDFFIQYFRNFRTMLNRCNKCYASAIEYYNKLSKDKKNNINSKKMM